MFMKNIFLVLFSRFVRVFCKHGFKDKFTTNSKLVAKNAKSDADLEFVKKVAKNFYKKKFISLKEEELCGFRFFTSVCKSS